MKVSFAGITFSSQTASFDAAHPMFKLDVPPVPESIREILNRYSQFVVVGMGGSVLPLKAFTDALHLDQQIVYLDHLDRRRFVRLIEQKNNLFCIVSKSGETLEVRTLYQEILRPTRGADCMIVTDPTRGSLRKYAKDNGIPSLEIPADLGGRFTNFTVFHRALLERCGINFEEGLSRARSVVSSLKKNPDILKRLHESIFNDRVTKVVLWAYGSQTLGLAEWCQQILAESLGKKDPHGHRKGVFPIVLKGPQDQHSVLQLLMDGRQDHAFWFLQFRPESVPGVKKVIPSFEDLESLSLEEVENVLFDSTKRSFEERVQNVETAQPVVSFDIDDTFVDLCESVVTMQALIEYSGKRLQVNAFDQPGVERGKQIAREIIQMEKGPGPLND